MPRRETSRCKFIATTRPDYSSAAAAIIRLGGIVAIPTETSYGFAVDPFNEASLDRLFKVKRRPASKPVLVLIDSTAQLPRLIERIPEAYEPLIERFWPGPLTLIFPALPSLPEPLTAGSSTLGIRISSNHAATEICRRAGGVITATSANLSGESPARSALVLRSSFADSIDLVVDAGELEAVPPSTIIRCEEDRLVVVREGCIPAARIFSLTDR